jgi:predicted DNA-binding transcriptional regulator AlpA
MPRKKLDAVRVDQSDASMPRLLSMREVQQIIGYSRPSIYRLVARGVLPAPFKLGPAKIAFCESEIREWVESRARALGGDTPSARHAA